MQYKVGDMVWLLSLNKPHRIEKGCVEKVEKGGEFYRVRERDTLWIISSSEVYPTKEALLAAIDPHFTVGQTVWYLDRQIPQDVVCIYKDIIESVECNGNWFLLKSRSFHTVHLDDTFATPDEAFAKAKEVQGW